MVVVYLLMMAATLEAFQPAFKIARTRLQVATSFAILDNTFYLTQLDVSEHPKTSQLRKFVLDPIKKITLPNQWFPPPNSLSITSPIAVRIDTCKRLWLLDCGVTDIMGKQNRSHSPSLQIFDLLHNRTLQSYVFPKTLLSSSSLLTTFGVQVRSCDDTFAYIADFNRPAMLVYNFKINSAHSVEHHFYSPDPLSVIPRDMIFNKKFADLSGLFGIAVIGDQLFFHPMASKNEFVVKTDALRAGKPKYEAFALSLERPTEAGVEVSDPASGVRFFSEFHSIGCIGHSEKYVQLKMAAQQGLIWDLSINDTNLWVLANEDDSYNAKKLNIDSLIRNTSCYTENFVHARLDDLEGELITDGPGNMAVISQPLSALLLTFLYFICSVQ